MADGRLIPCTLGALALSYMVFGALHDISWGREDSYVVEYAFLAVSLPCSVLLHWRALGSLSGRSRTAWLAIASGLLSLFNLAALSASIRPKHVNDAAVGTAFLVVGLPLFLAVGRQFIRATIAPRQKHAG